MFILSFYPRDAMLAQYWVWPCICLSVYMCLAQVGVVSKRLNESSWFLAWELPSICPTLYCTNIRVPPKIRILPSKFVPNSGLRKFHHGS